MLTFDHYSKIPGQNPGSFPHDNACSYCVVFTHVAIDLTLILVVMLTTMFWHVAGTMRSQLPRLWLVNITFVLAG